MITLWKNFNNHHEWRGLSTDTKPTIHSDNNPDGAYNGDEYYEINTKKLWIFDESGNQWVDQS